MYHCILRKPGLGLWYMETPLIIKVSGVNDDSAGLLVNISETQNQNYINCSVTIIHHKEINYDQFAAGCGGKGVREPIVTFE